jgi:hypothetical protein
MADTKISALTAATTPLAGTEVLPIVQSSTTVKVSVANLTAGRAVSVLSLAATAGNVSVTGAANILQVLAGASVQIQNTASTANWNLATSGTGLTISSPQAGTLTLANNTSVTGTLSSTGIFSPQQATTAAAPAYVKGAMYFDTTLNKLRIGGATAWETVTSV